MVSWCRSHAGLVHDGQDCCENSHPGGDDSVIVPLTSDTEFRVCCQRNMGDQWLRIGYYELTRGEAVALAAELRDDPRMRHVRLQDRLVRSGIVVRSWADVAEGAT